jgi:hypothetical protein
MRRRESSHSPKFLRNYQRLWREDFNLLAKKPLEVGAFQHAFIAECRFLNKLYGALTK